MDDARLFMIGAGFRASGIICSCLRMLKHVNVTANCGMYVEQARRVGAEKEKNIIPRLLSRRYRNRPLKA